MCGRLVNLAHQASLTWEEEPIPALSRARASFCGVIGKGNDNKVCGFSWVMGSKCHHVQIYWTDRRKMSQQMISQSQQNNLIKNFSWEEKDLSMSGRNVNLVGSTFLNLCRSDYKQPQLTKPWLIRQSFHLCRCLRCAVACMVWEIRPWPSAKPVVKQRMDALPSGLFPPVCTLTGIKALSQERLLL